MWPFPRILRKISFWEFRKMGKDRESLHAQREISGMKISRKMFIGPCAQMEKISSLKEKLSRWVLSEFRYKCIIIFYYISYISE